MIIVLFATNIMSQTCKVCCTSTEPFVDIAGVKMCARCVAHMTMSFTIGADANTSLQTSPITGIRPVEDLKDAVYEEAIRTKALLVRLKLNIITVESLTCGMIAKTLVDIPGSGAVVYGGFCTYDTDAKREMVGVRTRGVYSHATAEQMATGGLSNSRAMVAIAVTGNSMPYPTENDLLGKVWIACAVRRADGSTTCNSKMLNVEETGEYGALFASWRKQNQGNGMFAPRSTTALVSDIVRLKTTQAAFALITSTLESATANSFGALTRRPWDTEVPPSWILQEHIKPSIDPMPSEPKSTDSSNWNDKHRNDHKSF